MADRYTSITGNQIRNDEVKPEDLSSLDSPSDNQIPSYDSASGKFDWVNPASDLI